MTVNLPPALNHFVSKPCKLTPIPLSCMSQAYKSPSADFKPSRNSVLFQRSPKWCATSWHYAGQPLQNGTQFLHCYASLTTQLTSRVLSSFASLGASSFGQGILEKAELVRSSSVVFLRNLKRPLSRSLYASTPLDMVLNHYIYRFSKILSCSNSLSAHATKNASKGSEIHIRAPDT
jgi:hypothetical protein